MDGCLGVVALGLAIWAVVEARAARSRSRRLEAEIASLENALRRLGAASHTLHPAPSAPPQPTPPVTTAPAAAAAAPAPATSAPSTPPPLVPPALAPPALAPGPASPSRPAPQPALAAPARPTPAPEPARPAIEWERWLGIRGAAVLGGIALALAALFLFRYAVEQGWLSPAVRVSMGLAGSGLALGLSWLARRRGYGAAANALAGASLVGFYASFWAAHHLYGLIGAWPAAAAMAAVTAMGCILADRHRSMVIAALGLAGGFATPLMVTGLDTGLPGLTAYLLLLNGGLLYLARRRGWSGIAVAALTLTGLHLAFELRNPLDELAAQTALVASLLLGAVFVAAGELRRRETSAESSGARSWPILGAIAAIAPALTALHLVADDTLEIPLLPLGIFLLILHAGAVWLARRRESAELPAIAVVAASVVLAVRLSPEALLGATLWQALALMAVLALVHALGLARFTGRRAVGLFVSIGTLYVLSAGLALSRPQPSPWPWWALWTLLGVLLALRSRRQDAAPMELAGGALAGAGLLGTGLANFLGAQALHQMLSQAPTGKLLAFALTGLGSALAIQFLAARRFWPRLAGWRSMRRGAVALPLLLLFGLVITLEDGFGALAEPFFAIEALALAVIAAWAAFRLGEGPWYPAIAAGLWASQLHHGENSPRGFVAGALAAALLTLSPFLARRHFAASRWGWAGAIAVPLLWLAVLWKPYLAVLADSRRGGLAAALGALALLGGWLAHRQVGVLTRPRRLAQSPRWARAGFTAMAVGLLTLAICLHFEREWLTIVLALWAGVLLYCARRAQSLALEVFALALLGAVTARLVFNPWVLSYHPASGVPILNWLAYTYLVPAAVMLWGWRRLRENRTGALVCAASAIAVVFAWINLTVLDAFSTGGAIQLPRAHLPARDLTLSLAWAAFALTLLVMGVRGRGAGLRRAGLGFLIATIVKVFLYDLGELSDLYRVASLVGLAATLLLVSVAYQRFIARSE